MPQAEHHALADKVCKERNPSASPAEQSGKSRQWADIVVVQHDGSLPGILKVIARHTGGRIAHINREVFHSIHNLRDDLSCARSTAHDGDLLSRQVIVMAPVSSMPGDTSVFVAARCCPEFGPIQSSNTLAYEVCQPLLRFTGIIALDSDTPFENVVVPVA